MSGGHIQVEPIYGESRTRHPWGGVVSGLRARSSAVRRKRIGCHSRNHSRPDRWPIYQLQCCFEFETRVLGGTGSGRVGRRDSAVWGALTSYRPTDRACGACAVGPDAAQRFSRRTGAAMLHSVLCRVRPVGSGLSVFPLPDMRRR